MFVFREINVCLKWQSHDINAIGEGKLGKLLWVIGKFKKDSATVHTHCSGEGREKREGKCFCGDNHITSLLYVREERKSSNSLL